MWFVPYVMKYMWFFFRKHVTSTSFHLFVVDFMVLNCSLFYLFNIDLFGQRFLDGTWAKRSLWPLWKWKGIGSSGKLQGHVEVMQGENGKGQSPTRTETWYCHRKPVKKDSINSLAGVEPILGALFCFHLCPSAQCSGFLEDNSSYCWRVRQRRNSIPQHFPHPLWLNFALSVKDGLHGVMEWFEMKVASKLI